VSEKPGALRVLARGLRRRCGRCGQGGLFRSYFDMVERCPRCGLEFERGEGYWLGAMAVNLGAAETAFAIALAIGVALTWPDPPWVVLTLVGLAVNATMPFLFYPFSKALFVGLDLLLIHTNERTWRPGEVGPAPRTG
jgi:uncharacterized protein (DUF983 family)